MIREGSPFFSVIVPTYNESEDVDGTIRCLLDQDFADFEILFMDDSTDDTVRKIEAWKDGRIRVVHPAGGGRCEARNRGIEMARGAVHVILNADVRPRRDFLGRLHRHYVSDPALGFLLVEARISNVESLYARYVEAVARRFVSSGDLDRKMNWTEGFSVRAEFSKKCLFPSGFPVKIVAGEDGFFGEQLVAHGAKKKIDLEIVVDHVAPSTFREYWKIRKGRGWGVPQVQRYLEGRSFPYLCLWGLRYSLMIALYSITVLPALRYTYLAAAAYGESRLKDTIRFLGPWFLEQMAILSGLAGSVLEIAKKERSSP